MKKYINIKQFKIYTKCLLIFIFTLIILLFSIYFIKIINQNKNYILKINDEYISKEEFLLYLNEQELAFEEIGGIDIWSTDFDGISAKNIAKNNTINSIVFLKAIVYTADDINISLTKEDKIYSKQKAKILKQNIEKRKPDLTIPLKICEKFVKENLIEQKVYDYITSIFMLDEKDFEKYFNNYIQNNMDKINKINLDYIFIQNNNKYKAIEKAKDISKNTNFNTDFNIFKNYPFIEVYKNINLEPNLFDKNIEDKIYKLSEKSVSSVSSIIEGTNGFYIFKINKIVKQNIQDVKKSVKQEYIIEKKNDLYSMQTKGWFDNIKVDKNVENLSKI